MGRTISRFQSADGLTAPNALENMETWIGTERGDRRRALGAGFGSEYENLAQRCARHRKIKRLDRLLRQRRILSAAALDARRNGGFWRRMRLRRGIGRRATTFRLDGTSVVPLESLKNPTRPRRQSEKDARRDGDKLMKKGVHDCIIRNPTRESAAVFRHERNETRPFAICRLVPGDACVCPRAARLRSLLRLRPNANVAVFIHFDVNHIRTTADGTIFDITLRGAGRQVDGHDDFFAAGIADVARLVVQCRSRYFVLAGGDCKCFGKSRASSTTGAPAAGISWPAVQRMPFVKKRR